MGEESAVERKQRLSRERGRRYRERNLDKVREMARNRAAEYRLRHPERVKESEKKSSQRSKKIVNADPYSAVLKRASFFWSNVDSTRDACWPWKGGLTRQGYGRVNASSGRWLPASRVALMLVLGRNLGDKMLACHTCDNPICCNPKHLYEGTVSQNALDAVVRGRKVPRRGHKIDERIAKEILVSPGTQEEIASKFGISRSFVSMIKSGTRWRRIQQAEGNQQNV